MPSAALTAAYRSSRGAPARGFLILSGATILFASAALAVALLEGGAALPWTTTVFWVFAAGCVVGELFPVHLGRTRHYDQVTMSSAFAFAILLGFGALAAMVVYVVASMVADGKDRVGIAKAAFNAGQYVIALAAAAVVLNAFGYVPDTRYEPTELFPMIAAAAAFFSVNHFMAGTGAALLTGTGVRRYVSADLGFHVWTAGFQLALAPLALIAAHTQLSLVPLLSLPLVGMYVGGRHAVDHAHLRYESAAAGSDQR